MKTAKKPSKDRVKPNILERLFIIASALGIVLPLADYLIYHPTMSEMSAVIFGWHAGFFCLLLLYGVYSELTRPSPQAWKRGYRGLLDRVKVYYDFLELSDRQIKSIIRMIRLLSRGNKDKR